MNMPKRERRDWGLIIFIIPIGIFLIVIVGQLAIGLFPNWRINADMGSNLDPNTVPGQPASLLQPLLPQILTPMAWAESYLTPGADISFPPFFVIQPTSSASPSPTPVSPTPTTATPTASATPSPTYTSTSTPSPTDDNEETPTPTSTTATSTSTATATGTATSTAAPTGYPSTPTGALITPAPTEINTDAPNGNSVELNNGNYIVLNFTGNPIYVSLTPDAYYDLIFYESEYGVGNILLDHIIIGISQFADGSSYYEVFNWGNGIPDNNSNIGDVAGTEDDNQTVPTTELHDPDGAGPAPQTGILIDVDTATSEPPPDTYYNYIVIISPNTGDGDASQIDAVVVTEVPIPTP